MSEVSLPDKVEMSHDLEEEGGDEDEEIDLDTILEEEEEETQAPKEQEPKAVGFYGSSQGQKKGFFQGALFGEDKGEGVYTSQIKASGCHRHQEDMPKPDDVTMRQRPGTAGPVGRRASKEKLAYAHVNPNERTIDRLRRRANQTQTKGGSSAFELPEHYEFNKFSSMQE